MILVSAAGPIQPLKDKTQYIQGNLQVLTITEAAGKAKINTAESNKSKLQSELKSDLKSNTKINQTKYSKMFFRRNNASKLLLPYIEKTTILTNSCCLYVQPTIG